MPQQQGILILQNPVTDILFSINGKQNAPTVIGKIIEFNDNTTVLNRVVNLASGTVNDKLIEF